MKLHRLFLVFLLAAALTFSSCAGPSAFNGGGGGAGGGGGVGGSGQATLSFILTDTPPAGVTVLAFDVTINGMTLTNTIGTTFALRGASTAMTIELSHLQTDFVSLGSFAFNADTLTEMQLSFVNPSVTFLNQSGGTIAGCANNTVCKVQPASAGSFIINTGVFPFVVDAGARTGLRLDFNLANALTSSMNVDFTQPSVLSVSKIPNTPTGQITSFDDLWGVATNIDPAAKTFLFGSERVRFFATVDANTVFDGFSGCPNDFTCLQNNQVISIDAGMNGDATIVAKEIQLEDTNNITDQLEGIITSVDTPTQFQVVATDKIQAGIADFLSGVAVGDPVTVVLSPAPAFEVSSKGLAVPATPLSFFTGATDTAQLTPGQRVTMRIVNSSAGPVFTTDRVRLRYTRTTGTVSGSPASPLFNIDNLPPLFGLIAPAQVQTFGNQTNFENVADVNNLAAGNTVSIRALYFKNSTPAFCATKVRKR